MILGKGLDVHLGDCRDVIRTLPDASVDSVVTDPPYALVSVVKRFGAPGAAPAQHGTDGLYARASAGFMGKQWDTGETAFAVDFWAEVLRVLKPGGHVAAFSGTRTYHRLACAIEDSGLEIRDQLAWTYGSGFPKSHDVSKAIDKHLGAEREVVGRGTSGKNSLMGGLAGTSGESGHDITSPASPQAQQWQGWGTALKPAWEPIVLARKPLIGTVASNVLEHGTGALNIDGCRVHADDAQGGRMRHGGGIPGNGTSYELPDYQAPMPAGRWPANIMHDGSDEVVACFPTPETARYFYCAKASKRDRGEGNKHPTVKPTDLMRWLTRLITPQGGVVLDPFMGSGSTGKACHLEGFQFIGVEREDEYFAMAVDRLMT